MNFKLCELSHFHKEQVIAWAKIDYFSLNRAIDFDNKKGLFVLLMGYRAWDDCRLFVI